MKQKFEYTICCKFFQIETLTPLNWIFDHEQNCLPEIIASDNFLPIKKATKKTSYQRLKIFEKMMIWIFNIGFKFFLLP